MAFLPNSYTHNWNLLDRLRDDGDYDILPIGRVDIECGIQGSASKCAIAHAALTFFGTDCNVRVIQGRKGPVLNMSNRKTRQRYSVELSPYDRFKPQDFDEHGRQVKAAPIVIEGTAIRIRPMEQRKDPRETQLQNAAAWKKRTDYKAPKPRKWKISSPPPPSAAPAK